MIETIATAVMSGLTTGIVVSMLSEKRFRRVKDRVQHLEDADFAGLKKRVEKITEAPCMHERRLQDMESGLKQQANDIHDTHRQIDRLVTSNEHMARSFRDYSTKLDIFIQATTEQGAQIKNQGQHLADLHHGFRAHADNRELHKNG